jgi:hypothetical protein
MVVSVRADSVKAYPKPKRGDVIATFAKDQLMGGKIDCISSNRMLRVTVDGTTGWILSRKVKMEDGPKLSSRCVEGKSTSVGATRAIGEGCGK